MEFFQMKKEMLKEESLESSYSCTMHCWTELVKVDTIIYFDGFYEKSEEVL